MIRRIYCAHCAGNLSPLHPEDVAEDWQMRQVNITAKKPKEHFIVANGVRHDIPVLVCDLCNAPIADGAKAVAVTQWRGTEPGPWEKEYEQ